MNQVTINTLSYMSIFWLMHAFVKCWKYLLRPSSHNTERPILVQARYYWTKLKNQTWKQTILFQVMNSGGWGKRQAWFNSRSTVLVRLLATLDWWIPIIAKVQDYITIFCNIGFNVYVVLLLLQYLVIWLLSSALSWSCSMHSIVSAVLQLSPSYVCIEALWSSRVWSNHQPPDFFRFCIAPLLTK